MNEVMGATEKKAKRRRTMEVAASHETTGTEVAETRTTRRQPSTSLLDVRRIVLLWALVSLQAREATALGRKGGAGGEQKLYRFFGKKVFMKPLDFFLVFF